jgi:AraC-like DNA-binding protein
MLSSMLQSSGYKSAPARHSQYDGPGDPVLLEAYCLSQEAKVEWSSVDAHGDLAELRRFFEIRTLTIIRKNGRRKVFVRSSEPVFIGDLLLQRHNLASITAAISGYHGVPSGPERYSAASEYLLSRMLRRKDTPCSTGTFLPETMADRQSMEGLEQALTELLVKRIATPTNGKPPKTLSRHDEIMRRFHTVVATAGGDVLPIPEVCADVDVPQRTLNLCCLESLGISPKSYLHLRRMHLARRMLTRPNAFVTTVTETAAHFGFYNFGRFAVQYRSLFGETPSQTLRGRGVLPPVTIVIT